MPEEAKKRVRPAENIIRIYSPCYKAFNHQIHRTRRTHHLLLANYHHQLILKTVRFADLTATQPFSKPIEHRLIKLVGTLAGKPARFLLDSGASHSYVSKSFVTEHSLSTSPRMMMSSLRLTVTLADGTINPSDGSLESAPVRISSYSDNFDFAVTEFSIVIRLHSWYVVASSLQSSHRLEGRYHLVRSRHIVACASIRRHVVVRPEALNRSTQYYHRSSS